MNIQEILEHNSKIREQVKSKIKLIHELENEIEDLQTKTIPPCRECNQDGFYRCEACQGDSYAGFNDPDYLDRF